MEKRALSAIALAFVFGAAACGPAATTASPSPSTATTSPSAATTPSATATPTATPTAVATPSATSSRSPRPDPTPVALTVTGHARSSDGRPLTGVRLRFLPFDMTGGCPIACPQAPGPNVIVTTDANGAFSATVMVWTLEALTESSSSQLSLFVTPPAGMKVVAITQSSTLPIGPFASNTPEWYFILEREVKGPIDITFAAQ